MVEHRVAAEADLAHDLDDGGGRGRALERSAGRGEAGFHAFEPAEKVPVPRRPAELAVGYGFEADVLLADDGALDRLILDCREFGRAQVARGMALAGVLDLGWPQQASDVVGAEWR